MATVKFGEFFDYEIAMKIVKSSNYHNENDIPSSSDEEALKKWSAEIGVEINDLKEYLVMYEKNHTK